MKWQLLIVIIFFLNLGLLWFIKAQWCQRLGSLLFAVLPLVTVFLKQPHFELDYFWWRIVGGVVIVLGFGLMAWAKIALGKGQTSLGETPESLCQSGPYQFVRHPIYLSLVLIWVGWWWVFAAVYSFYFGMFILAGAWLQGYFEEKLVLDKKFGGQFKEYCRQTGMFWVK